MSIPSSGRRTSETSPLISTDQEPSDTEAEAPSEGVFKAAGNNRSVHAHTDNPQYIPHETGQAGNRPLDDWEIEVQTVENHYLSTVAELPGEDDFNLSRSQIKETVKVVRNSLSTLSSHYKQRVAQLTEADRIGAQRANDVMEANQRLEPILQNLDALENSLAWTVRKKSLKASMTQLKSLMKQATGVITETKTRLIEPDSPDRTSPDELIAPAPETTPEPDEPERSASSENTPLAEVVAQEGSAPVSQVQQTIEPKQLLAEMADTIRQAKNPKVLKTSLESSVAELNSVLELLPTWIKEARVSEEDTEVLATYLSLFNNALEELRSISLESISKKERQQKQAIAIGLLEQCREMVVRIETVKDGQFDGYVAAHIKNPALKARVTAINHATTVEERQQAQKELHQFLKNEAEHYGRLEPVMNLAIKKSQLQQQATPSACKDVLNALSSLSGKIETLQEPDMSIQWMMAVEAADQYLGSLQQLEESLPQEVLPVLTSSPKPTPDFLHLLNPIARTFITKETKLASSAASKKLYSQMLNLLDAREKGDDRRSGLAFEAIISDIYSTTDFLANVLNQARTSEEIAALAQYMERWQDSGLSEVQETVRDLNKVKSDYQLDGIETGRDDLFYLVVNFPLICQKDTLEDATARFELLTQVLRESLTQQLEHRLNKLSIDKLLKSEKALHSEIEAEFNAALQGIAKVSLTPSKKGGDSSYTLGIMLTPESVSDSDFRQFLNSTTEPRKTIADAFKEALPDNMIHFDPVTKNLEFMPSSPEMLEHHKKDFLNRISHFHKAVKLAKKHRETIQSHVQVREQANNDIENVKNTLNNLERQLQAQPAKRKKTQISSQRHLESVKAATEALQESPLNQMSSEISNVSEQLQSMVFAKELHPEQAAAALTPLHQLLDTAQYGYREKRKVLTPQKAPEALTGILKKMDNTLRPRPLYKFLDWVFKRQRVKHFEQARDLVAISEQCPYGAGPNADMINKWLQTSGITQKATREQQDLVNRLEDYRRQLTSNARRSVVADAG